ncbi:MAG: neutral zinc metallopeptidase [Bacteroidales bacterium]|nr:neutral zinc metallopeptidase [Bacteroidales bacterium]MBP5382226.1 neutral zinc metallopeptidase [Bacteroidales bacterium]
MNLEGRRQSTNVDDRRGRSVGKAGGIGLGGILLAGILYLVFGINPAPVLEGAGALSGGNQTETNYTPTAEEEELAVFSKQILAGTEDVWTNIFKANGKTYQPPRLVLYNDYVQTSTGTASASTGPFYSSADQTVYIDLSFFSSMKQQIGADGDFAYAYVIAHEVGHHVQYLLGTLQQAHQQMQRVSEKEANQISVRLELQADFYAGVWAHHDNKMFSSLEAGDVEEGLAVAAKIGDDYLQKKAYGYTVPDSFNHGTSDQRSRWLKKGLSTGNPADGDTFSIAYNRL